MDIVKFALIMIQNMKKVHAGAMMDINYLIIQNVYYALMVVQNVIIIAQLMTLSV